MTRGASMTTDKHVDPTAPVPVAEEEDSDLTDVPEGAVRFELDPEEIAEALAAPSLQVPAVLYTPELTPIYHPSLVGMVWFSEPPL